MSKQAKRRVELATRTRRVSPGVPEPRPGACAVPDAREARDAPQEATGATESLSHGELMALIDREIERRGRLRAETAAAAVRDRLLPVVELLDPVRAGRHNRRAVARRANRAARKAVGAGPRPPAVPVARYDEDDDWESWLGAGGRDRELS